MTFKLCCSLQHLALFLWIGVFLFLTLSSRNNEDGTPWTITKEQEDQLHDDDDEDRPFLTLTINPGPTPGPSPKPIPDDFVGFSMEWNAEAMAMANSTTFSQLLLNLITPTVHKSRQKYSSKGPNIRVGGSSADKTWWNDQLDRNLSSSCSASYSGKWCVKTNMTQAILASLFNVAQRIRGSLVLDLTMVQNSSADWALEELTGILSQQQQHHQQDFDNPLLEGVEIGNEPDVFGSNGIRHPQYSISDYLREYELYLLRIRQAQIQGKLPQFPNGKKFLQGGTFCCLKGWWNQQAALMDLFEEHLFSWSVHHYPLNHCSGKKKKCASISNLLKEQATFGETERMAPWADYAQSKGIKFNIGEANSVNFSGMYNVSDTMASALWALDYMFEMAQLGSIDRINFHGGGGSGRDPYAWFVVNETTGIPTVKPLYYSMYLWWQITSPQQMAVYPIGCQGCGRGTTVPLSQLCQTGIVSDSVCCASECGDHCGGGGADCQTSPAGANKCCQTSILEHGRFCESPTDDGCILPTADQPRVKAWLLSTGNYPTPYTVVVINKLLHRLDPIKVALSVPPELAKCYWQKGGQLSSLYVNANGSEEVPVMKSTHNLYFAGMTWDGSKAGEPVGIYKADTILPDRNNIFTFEVAHGSVAIFRLDPDHVLHQQDLTTMS